MTIRSSVPLDTSSWLSIWSVAQTTVGMCLTQGKKGVFPQLGKRNSGFCDM